MEGEERECGGVMRIFSYIGVAVVVVLISSSDYVWFND